MVPLSSRPASGCSHNPLASHPLSPPTNPATAVLATAAHCSSRCCCCYLFHLLWPHALAFILPSFLRTLGTMFELCQKNPSGCLDSNLPFGFLSSSWFHAEAELFTHMFCAVLTHGTAASSVLCSEFLSYFVQKHKDIWAFCIGILCTFTFQHLT